LGEASPQQISQMARKATELDSHQMPPTEFFGAEPASYDYDLMARKEMEFARQLHVPVLILRGGRDSVVVDEDIDAGGKLWRACRMFGP
jgi:alpha-beta hydrolase superfamily lysophospholipase